MKINETQKTVALILATLASLPAFGYVFNYVLRMVAGNPHWYLIANLLQTGHKALGIILVIFLLRWFRIGVALDRPISGFVKGLLYGLAVIVPAGCISLPLREFFLSSHTAQSPLEAVQATAINGSAFFTFLNGGILAPIYEELLFRSLIQQQLRRVVPAGVSIAISAAVFALMHGTDMGWASFKVFMLVDFLPLLFIGLVYGALYNRNGLLAAVGAHACFNLREHFLSYLTTENHILWFVLIALVGAVSICLLFISQFRGIRHEH